MVFPVLYHFIFVLNQEDISCLIWDLVFKLFVDLWSQAQSKKSVGILFLYLSREALQKLVCSFLLAPCFTSTHIHIWELPSTTTVFYSWAFTVGALLRDTLVVAIEFQRLSNIFPIFPSMFL